MGYMCRLEPWLSAEGVGQTENVASALYTLSCIKKIADEKLLYNTGSPLLLFNDLEGWDGGKGREAQEEGDIRIIMADLHCCTAKPTQHCNFPPIKFLINIIMQKT